jgi:hypothetical protein
MYLKILTSIKSYSLFFYFLYINKLKNIKLFLNYLKKNIFIIFKFYGKKSNKSYLTIITDIKNSLSFYNYSEANLNRYSYYFTAYKTISLLFYNDSEEYNNVYPFYKTTHKIIYLSFYNDLEAK